MTRYSSATMMIISSVYCCSGAGAWTDICSSRTHLTVRLLATNSQYCLADNADICNYTQERFVTFVVPFNVGLMIPQKESYRAIRPSSTGAAWTCHQLIAGPRYIGKQPFPHNSFHSICTSGHIQVSH